LIPFLIWVAVRPVGTGAGMREARKDEADRESGCDQETQAEMGFRHH
jgi:hypothetical protein